MSTQSQLEQYLALDKGDRKRWSVCLALAILHINPKENIALMVAAGADELARHVKRFAGQAELKVEDCDRIHRILAFTLKFPEAVMTPALAETL